VAGRASSVIRAVTTLKHKEALASPFFEKLSLGKRVKCDEKLKSTQEI